MTTSAISKNFALNGAHTAGIFADMTVDGPEIGTLVCVVDRAKNLPNRKTIGKQDPYCAARLGKEAKKTSTDIRGGQTPRWDQELRFTVHDTADYYQLKVSVFTDDKKTDLIGETWVDLKTIITSGGGQCDFWQTLTCRGKYAGEIRLEITYYDTRPKPDKSPPKPKPPSPDYQEMSPVKRKDVIKRRPVSMDPVTAEMISAPLAAATAAAAAAAAAANGGAGPANDAPRMLPRAPGMSDYNNSSLRGSRQSLGTVGGPRELRALRRDAYENPRHSEERDLGQRISDPRADYAANTSDREESWQQQQQQQQQQLLYQPHQQQHQHHQQQGGYPPPPPPAHRPRHDSDVVHRSSFEDGIQRAIYPPGMRHEMLKHEPQRKASPSYPGRPKFRGTLPPAHPSAPTQKTLTYNPHMERDIYDVYDPQRSMQPTVEDYPESEAGSFGGNYRHSGPRGHHQPHPHPHPHPLHQHQHQHHDEMALAYDRGYDPRAVVAPPAMSRSPGAAGGYLSQSPGHMQNDYDYREQHRYTRSGPQMDPRDYEDVAAQAAYNNQAAVGHVHGHGQGQGRRHSPPYEQRQQAYHHPNTSSHSLHDVPSSLAPGADSNPAHDIPHRMYDDRRYEYDERYQGGQSMAISTRDRPRNEPSMYDARGALSQANTVQRYDRPRPDMNYYEGSDTQMPRHRNASPNPPRSPNHAIRRKSVSPAPPISENRRLSDVPYGPDSYDTYNPSVSRGGTPGLGPETPSKIVMHDGREVDPSDHLPEESWAPEPEPKPTQAQAQAPSPAETRTRPALTGSQPMPPSGRRQLRVRAQSNASPSHSSEDLRLTQVTQGAPPPTVRGRLRKKTDRVSMPAASPSGMDLHGSHSSDEMHDRHSQYSHARAPRTGNTWDYANDGYGAQYPGGAHGPPIPAKLPLPLPMMSGGVAEVALMEEMQKIDIGSGRSRRRGGH